jgi:hypothetical protein
MKKGAAVRLLAGHGALLRFILPVSCSDGGHSDATTHAEDVKHCPFVS